MTYREMFDEVVMTGKYVSSMAKLKALAQLIYDNDFTLGKTDCVWAALEKLEDMTGHYVSPTKRQFDEILFSII